MCQWKEPKKESKTKYKKLYNGGHRCNMMWWHVITSSGNERNIYLNQRYLNDKFSGIDKFLQH